jgi:hypothetical protein
MVFPRSDDSPRAFHLIGDRLTSVIYLRSASTDIRTHLGTHNLMLPSFDPMASELTPEFAFTCNQTHPPFLLHPFHPSNLASYTRLGTVLVLGTYIISYPQSILAILMLVHCGRIPCHRFLLSPSLSKTGILYLIFLERPSLSTRVHQEIPRIQLSDFRNLGPF